jgi:hypothetical protein
MSKTASPPPRRTWTWIGNNARCCRKRTYSHLFQRPSAWQENNNLHVGTLSGVDRSIHYDAEQKEEQWARTASPVAKPRPFAILIVKGDPVSGAEKQLRPFFESPDLRPLTSSPPRFSHAPNGPLWFDSSDALRAGHVAHREDQAGDDRQARRPDRLGILCRKLPELGPRNRYGGQPAQRPRPRSKDGRRPCRHDG